MKNYCFVLSWRLGILPTPSRAALLAALVRNLAGQDRSCLGGVLGEFVVRLHSSPGKLLAGTEVTNSCRHREFNATGQTLPSDRASFLQSLGAARSHVSDLSQFEHRKPSVALGVTGLLGGLVRELPLAAGAR